MTEDVSAAVAVRSAALEDAARSDAEARAVLDEARRAAAVAAGLASARRAELRALVVAALRGPGRRQRYSEVARATGLSRATLAVWVRRADGASVDDGSRLW